MLPRVGIDASDDLKSACETLCILVCYFPLPLVGWYQSSPQRTNFEFLPSKIVFHSSRRHQSSGLVTQTLMSASLFCNMMMKLYSAAEAFFKCFKYLINTFLRRILICLYFHHLRSNIQLRNFFFKSIINQLSSRFKYFKNTIMIWLRNVLLFHSFSHVFWKYVLSHVRLK